MGRYTLKVSYGSNNTTINVPENDRIKEKVSLMAIDSFTIGKSPEFILKDLNFDQAILKGQRNFYISYISNGHEKHLTPIFDDTHQLKKIADVGERQINLNNAVFIQFIDQTFLPLIKDKNFIRFLKNNSLITLKLEEWVQNHLSSAFEFDFTYSKLLEHSSNYKQFRALIIGTELYNSQKAKQQKPTEIVKNDRPYYEKYVLSRMSESNPSDYDPDKEFGLCSEEELRAYDEYLSGLPDEFEAHEDRHNEQFNRQLVKQRVV